MQFHTKIFLFTILLSVTVLPQWERVHRPMGKVLYSIDFVSEDIGFLGGEKLFAATTDGGRTWLTINNFNNRTMLGLDFINETHGIAVGRRYLHSGGILCYTTNSGNDWNYAIYNMYGPITDVFLQDSLHGWAISEFGYILKMNSGFDDWEAVASLNTSFNDLYFVNENIGWVVGGNYADGGLILKTTDGGSNWSEIEADTINILLSVDFRNENEGWVTTNNKEILHTTDSGNTWTKIQLPENGRDIRFISDSLGYIVSSGGFMKTTDGGNTWINHLLPGSYYFTGMEFYDENIGYLIGSNEKMIKTTDGGDDWINMTLSEFNELNGIHMCNGSNGVAVGNYGTILRTSTGDEWVSGICSTYNHLNSVFTFDNNTAIAVGDSGIIIKSINSAYLTWTKKSSGVVNNLNSITFIDNDIGWIAGDDGVILKTTDGGESWHQFSGGTTMNLNSISFSNHFHGWAAGNGGVIKTTDGGANWFPQTIPNDDYLCIQMLDSYGGYVLGQDGKLFRTYDGGLSWDSIYMAPYPPWLSFSFYNMWIGWSTSELGRVYYTQSIGSDWFLQTGLNIYNLNSIQALSNQVVYAAGGGGYIMRTSNGGIPVPVELVSFSAIQEGGRVYLNWQTATELNNSMFEVQRKTEDTDWLTIGYIPGAGTTTEMQKYEYIDDCYGVPGGSNLIYRLKQIDYNGDFEYSDEISIEKLILKEYRLYQNYPNPFNASTSIKYSIPVESIVTLEILDVLGKRTALLVHESKNAGVYETVWNAADVSSGIYFIRIRVGSFTETKKMLLLK